MDAQLERMRQDLTDPITLELVEDPIIVPCCTKAFSRLSLVQAFESAEKQCPSCRQLLPDFDPMTAPTNLVMASMVATLKLPTNAAKWSASLTPVIGNLAELKISLENSQFKIRPSLFIPVCDTSGSMSGNPRQQVEAALIHIMAIARLNPMIQTSIIRYSSMASVIDTTGSQDDIIRRINNMYDGGGTNFLAAFEKIRDTLANYVYSDQPLPHAISNVTIVFMTDGQDGSSKNRDELVAFLRESLIEWNGPICVHTVGFSGGCDKQFLEKLRLTGTVEGTFRYAEPQDDPDTLCQKLTGLFDVIARNSSVPVTFSLQNGLFRLNANKLEDTASVQFPVGRNNKGVYSTWVTFDRLPTLHIKSANLGTQIPVTLNDSRFVDEKQKTLFQQWIATLLDEMAAEILDLSKTPKNLVFDLHCALILQRLDAIRLKSQVGQFERLDFLVQQVTALRKGSEVHVGKLSDARFSSQFAPVKSTSVHKSISAASPLAIQDTHNQTSDGLTYKRESHLRRYSHNNVGKNRNAIQEAICALNCNKLSPVIEAMIDGLQQADITHTDIDGNNTLHLAAYCGCSLILERILQKAVGVNINAANNDDETAITLAIKKQGFWKCIKMLVRHNAFITDDRLKALEAYAVDIGYVVTAKLLATLSNGNADMNCKQVDIKMTAEYIDFLYDTAIEKKIEFDVQSYLRAALAKRMTKLVKTLLTVHQAVPDINMLMDYCFPEKPDDPETDSYLDLVKLLIKNRPELLQETNALGETLLYRSVDRGSLPHVKYFLRHPLRVCPKDKSVPLEELYVLNIDQPNHEGNTPFWCATCKQYPCIMEELLDNGANINQQNTKMNTPPIFTITRWGSIKIAEMLIARGARLDLKNNNGDNIILLCCRSNGQGDKLALFLKYVDPEMVTYKAEIDGFCAIFAAVEANNIEAIQVLRDYGVDFEQRTANDNKILPGATPLHLGAYYGRNEAVSKLLELGANVNALDMNGATALHVAVLQRHPSIIKLLRNAGIDLSIRDSNGSTASEYCRNDPDIRDLLISPVLDPLMLLARGEFGKDTDRACEVLRKHSGALGCLNINSALDLISQDRRTPLLQSVMCSNYPVAKTLIELHCGTNLYDRHGLTAHVWANWINNMRMKQLLAGRDNNVEYTQKCLQRLTSVPSQYRMFLFISNCPKTLSDRSSSISCSASAINFRMEHFTNMIEVCNSGGILFKITDVDSNNRALIPVFEKTDFGEENYESLVWSAKVFTVGLIASGLTTLTPDQIMAICLYSSNRTIARTINESILNKSAGNYYLKCLVEAYENLPPYVGEVYIGTNAVDRSLFQVGAKIAFKTIVSASTSWRVATEHLPDFAKSKKRRGEVFIVKTKTGRFISPYSEFMYDMEVLIKPGTAFEVTNWYIGDVICLGQENIRENTFGLMDKDARDEFLLGKRALIIELIEL